MFVQTTSGRPEVESNVENIPWRCTFRYVTGTHEVPARLPVQSTEHSFHDKSLAPECIWGEWIYTGIIDPPHILSSPRFDPFLSYVCTCVSSSSPLRPFSVPLSLRSRRPLLYNDRPARPSASLYLPPSASFYNHQLLHRHFQRLWNHPGRPNPGAVVFHRDAMADGRGKKESKNRRLEKLHVA